VADLWYYSHDKQKIGPCSARRMKELAADGSILPTDVVWKEGVEKGVAANKVKHLFQPAAPAQQRPEDDPVVPAVAPVGWVEAPPSPVVPEPVPPEEAAVTEAELPAPPLAPAEPPPVAPDASASNWQQPARKGRATAGRGAVLVGQDGVTVKFRKKCTTCGHVDSSWQTMPIRNGTMRSSFYCPKCRKSRDVEVNGSLN
jgi:hypothetical protein